MIGGTQFVVQWQQNFNHYEPGYPGFMDISWSLIPNPTSDNDFFTLDVIPDFNAHMQWNQQNFSRTITVPNVDCPHCVLRMRYAPNKPTEGIFYQCSDITIRSAAPSQSLYGVQFQEDGSPSQLVQLDPITGSVAILSALLYNVRKSVSQDGAYPSISDQVCAIGASGVLYYTASSGANVGSVPDTLVTVNLTTYSASSTPLFLPNGAPLVAINYDPIRDALIGLQILPVPTNNQYGQFNLVWVNPSTGLITQINTPFVQDNTWVNFQWTEFDPKSRLYYLLAGNENDPVGLTTLLYTVNVDSGQIVNQVFPSANVYTIAGIHYDPETATLLAMSPGLFNTSGTTYSWSMVTVNPVTGNVTLKYHIAAAGEFTNYYGGDVYGSLQYSRDLYYVFYTDPSHTTGVVGTINVDTGKTDFVNANNLQKIHNLAAVF
jgi:hypothetical protein